MNCKNKYIISSMLYHLDKGTEHEETIPLTLGNLGNADNILKCQILFSGKNKKNIINLPSTEFAHKVVKVASFFHLAYCV